MTMKLILAILLALSLAACVDDPRYNGSPCLNGKEPVHGNCQGE